MTRANILAGCAAFLAATAAAAQNSPSGATGRQAERLLAAQNHERELVGAPPLEWDAGLAAHAASYGPVLASLGQLVHSPREGRPGERENLVKAWHGTMSPEQMVDLWSREKLLLQPVVFPAVSRNIFSCPGLFIGQARTLLASQPVRAWTFLCMSNMQRLPERY